MTFTASMKTALLSAVLVLLAALCFGGGYWVINRAHRTNAEEAQQLSDAMARAQHSQSMQMLLADTALSRMELESYFVDPEMLVVFLELVEGVAQDAGVDLTIESVTEQAALVPGAPAAKSKKEQGPTYPAVAIGGVFSGSWESVTRFVARIDTLPYGVSITSLNIERDPESAGWTGSLNFLVATKAQEE